MVGSNPNTTTSKADSLRRVVCNTISDGVIVFKGTNVRLSKG